jgi:hypothetical protein
MRSRVWFICIAISAGFGCGGSGSGANGGSGGKAGSSGAGGGMGGFGGEAAGGADGSGAGGSGGGATGSDAGLATTCTGGGQVSGDGCNTVNATGPCVNTTTSTSAAPTPTGAVNGVAAGRYVLIASTLYTAPGGTNHEPARRETLTVGAGTKTSFVLNWTQVSGTTTTRWSGGATVAIDEISYVVTCPEFAPEQDFHFSFDAATNTLLFIEPNAQGGTLVSTYALQPTTTDAGAD